MTTRSEPGLDVIQSLWIGDSLPEMARLSIQSFLDQGHPFHFYSYTAVQGVPPGVIHRPASDILPASAVFQYREHNSYAGFANHFRYKLLLERGGWWSDADVVCLCPFAIDEEHVFSSELHDGRPYLNATVIKAPAESPVMAAAVKFCAVSDHTKLNWGDTGSRLITTLVDQFGMAAQVQPAEIFCPIGYADWLSLLDGDDPADPGENALGLHLWNEMWRRAGQTSDDRHDPRCLFEQLRRRHPVQ